ncbi:hypothetical protein EB796_005960 [Bugula neritina]|uniref:Uncharacterized protein n=1 Tax=Bugula neritina TaxID=10212 RepID=A0A7J7KCQ7_BUGNE|nr:hypothetical protein EB796_005960 [Bugula neritina]
MQKIDNKCETISLHSGVIRRLSRIPKDSSEEWYTERFTFNTCLQKRINLSIQIVKIKIRINEYMLMKSMKFQPKQYGKVTYTTN